MIESGSMPVPGSVPPTPVTTLDPADGLLSAVVVPASPSVDVTPISTIPTDTVEPGYSTTEFWGKVAAQLLTAVFAWLATQGHNVDGTTQALVLGVAASVIAALEGFYGRNRTLRKMAG